MSMYGVESPTGIWGWVTVHSQPQSSWRKIEDIPSPALTISSRGSRLRQGTKAKVSFKIWTRVTSRRRAQAATSWPSWIVYMLRPLMV